MSVLKLYSYSRLYMLIRTHTTHWTERKGERERVCVLIILPAYLIQLTLLFTTSSFICAPFSCMGLFSFYFSTYLLFVDFVLYVFAFLLYRSLKIDWWKLLNEISWEFYKFESLVIISHHNLIKDNNNNNKKSEKNSLLLFDISCDKIEARERRRCRMRKIKSNRKKIHTRIRWCY